MISRFSRGVVALAATSLCLFVFGAPAASPDIGVQNVNLACNDGTKLSMALGLSSVNALTDAVNGINLYPAGDPALACSLTQVATLRALSSAGGNGNGPQDYAVGGGQFINPSRGAMCEQNFAISAHSPDAETPTPTSGGTANLTVPNSPACTGGVGRLSEGGNLVTKIDCLQVTGNTADFTSVVTKSTGTFADEGITPSGSSTGTVHELAWEVKDLNKDVPPVPDEININYATAPCDFTATATPTFFSVDHGNINVNDNE